MAVKIIPEKRIFICDCCGKEEARRVKNATLIIKRHALDYLGQPAADGMRSCAVCDSCHDDIVSAINATCELIREKAGKANENKMF